MKKLFIFLGSFPFIVAFAQFNPNYSLNYFDQVNHWNAYYDSVQSARMAVGNTSMKGIGFGKYQQWQQYWRPFITETGNFQDAFQVQGQFLSQQQFTHILSSSTVPNNTSLLLAPPVDWEELGPDHLNNIYGLSPFSSQWENPHANGANDFGFYGHVGKIDRIFQHPTQSNTFYALGGDAFAGAGGLFVSADGALTWNNMNTDKITNSNPITLAIKPLGMDPAPFDEFIFMGFSSGAVYRTTDNGANWIESGYSGPITYPLTTAPNSYSLPVTNYYQNAQVSYEDQIHEFKFDKTDIDPSPYARMFVCCKDGIFYSDNYWAGQTITGNSLYNGIAWFKMQSVNDLFEPSSLPYVNPDLLHPVNQHIIHAGDLESYDRGGVHYIVAHIARKEMENTNVVAVYDYVIVSSDYGATWSFLGGLAGSPNPNGRNGSNGNRAAATNIEMKSSEPTLIYVNYMSATTGGYTLFRYDIVTGLWSDLSNPYGTNYGIQTFPHSFAMNPNDEDEYWILMNDLRHFDNGMLTTTYDDYNKKKHPDVRDLLILDDLNMLIGTDGGVYRSGNAALTFTPVSEGLNASMSSTIGLAQKPPFYVASGFWHCGFQVFNPMDGPDGKWHSGAGSDGKSGDIAFLNNEKFTFYVGNGGQSQILSNYNLLTGSADCKTGSVAWSENKSGLAYVFRHSINLFCPGMGPGPYPNPGSNTYNLYQSFDDLNTTPPVPINLPHGDFNSGPGIYVVPNAPNQLVILEQFSIADGGSRLYFYDDMLTANPTLTKEIILNDLYHNLTSYPVGINPQFWSIVFDPNDPRHFYMILNSTAQYSPNFNKYRIVEYDPILDDYKDLSYPTDDVLFLGPQDAFPSFLFINSIELDRQTGILYVGTPNGVYYLDRDLVTPSNSIWRKYSKNVPAYSNDIGIIHCTGEIYTATAARGIWKAPLIRENIATREWVIDQNTIWNDRMNLFCTLVIEPGKTLTINNELVVYGYQKIIVKPGGTLIIDGTNGGKITTECGDFWEGIQVWGNPAANQFPTLGQYAQGRLIMRDGAIVENAREAVRLHNPSDGYGGQVTTGGIVQATNSIIRDCRRSVEFLAYKNFRVGGNPSVATDVRPNRSFFRDCVFETTKDLPQNTLPYAFITMWGVNGINITGCTFENSNPDLTDPSLAGRGIYCIDADFKVVPDCDVLVPLGTPCPVGSVDKNIFKHLWVGVWPVKGSTNYTYVLNSSDFLNCQVGLLSDGVSNMLITENDFYVGDMAAATNTTSQWGAGLFNGIFGYKFEGNDFSVDGPSGNLTGGTFSYNQGAANNIIYRNTFTGLEWGNEALGINKWPGDLSYTPGLSYICNDHDDDPSYPLMLCNIYAPNPLGSSGTAAYWGIKPYQGNLTLEAGNCFTNNTLVESDIYNRTPNVIRYFYKVPPTCHQPLYFTPIKVQPATSGLTNPCSSTYSANPDLAINANLTASVRNSMEDAYIQQSSHYLLYKQLYTNLIDGGNTHNIKNHIENSIPADVADLRNLLLQNSPFLSEDVIKAVTNKSDVLPDAIMFEILIANPKALSNDKMLEHLGSKANPLPQWMIDYLRINRGQITYQTVVSSAVSYYDEQRTLSLNAIVGDILADTNGVDHDTLRMWLAEYRNPQADYQIVNSFIETGDYEDALDFLGTIDDAYELKDDALGDYNNFRSFTQFYIEKLQEGKNEASYNANDVIALQIIADESEYTGSQRAKNILNFFYGYDYWIDPLPFDKKKSTEIEITVEIPNEIMVFPNPSSDWVALTYQLYGNHPNLNIVVTDILGRVVYSNILTNTIGNHVMDVREWQSGTYIYSLLSDGVSIQNGKFIVQ